MTIYCSNWPHGKGHTGTLREGLVPSDTVGKTGKAFAWGERAAKVRLISPALMGYPLTSAVASSVWSWLLLLLLLLLATGRSTVARQNRPHFRCKVMVSQDAHQKGPDVISFLPPLKRIPYPSPRLMCVHLLTSPFGLARHILAKGNCTSLSSPNSPPQLTLISLLFIYF